MGTIISAYRWDGGAGVGTEVETTAAEAEIGTPLLSSAFDGIGGGGAEAATPMESPTSFLFLFRPNSIRWDVPTLLLFPPFFILLIPILLLLLLLLSSLLLQAAEMAAAVLKFASTMMGDVRPPLLWNVAMAVLSCRSWCNGSRRTDGNALRIHWI